MKAIDEDDVDKVYLQIQSELNKTNFGRKVMETNENNRKPYCGPGFVMDIPSGFEKAGQDITSTIFFSKNRPDIVLTKPDSHAGLSFQIIRKLDIESMDLKQVGLEICGILKQSDVKSVFYDQGTVSNNLEVFWFDYKSFASDERVYNFMFLFEGTESLIIGSFYCMFQYYGRWKPEMIDIMHTIQIRRLDYERI